MYFSRVPAYAGLRASVSETGIEATSPATPGFLWRALRGSTPGVPATIRDDDRGVAAPRWDRGEPGAAPPPDAQPASGAAG